MNCLFFGSARSMPSLVKEAPYKNKLTRCKEVIMDFIIGN
jgi:hypothetical protein